MTGKFFLSVFLFVIIFPSFLRCKVQPYKDIIVDGQVISGDCSAWTNECHTYCRVPATAGYDFDTIRTNNTLCKEKTTTQFVCIDDNPKKLMVCKTESCDYVGHSSQADKPKKCQGS